MAENIKKADNSESVGSCATVTYELVTSSIYRVWGAAKVNYKPSYCLCRGQTRYVSWEMCYSYIRARNGVAATFATCLQGQYRLHRPSSKQQPRPTCLIRLPCYIRRELNKKPPPSMTLVSGAAMVWPTNYTTGTRTAHKQHVVFSGRTQLCVTGVSMDLQALKVGKNSPSSVLHANDADLRTH
ncbi:hypothetical protein J6590_080166 [Homalodisca vitripennis]|nr:hypothetical protein J6590_080166 [Homalodisca vitripennis]